MSKFKGISINFHFVCTPTKFETVLFFLAFLTPFIVFIKFITSGGEGFIFFLLSFLIPFIVGFGIIIKHNYIDKDVETTVDKTNDFKKDNNDDA